MATELDTNTASDTGGDDAEELSLRDTIDAAFEETATDEPQDTPASRARDEQGRFASKAATPAAQVAPGPAPAAQQAQQAAADLTQVNGLPQQGQGAAPAAPELKAPASWRPEAREKWASIDPDIRAEIHKRESEANRVVQTAAQQRQFVEQFEKLMQPYEMFIRAENSNPLAAVDNMMRTAAELRVGTPMAKANLVAGIIRNFGIDLPMLDSILAGQPPQGVANPGQAQFHDPRVDQLLAMQAQQAQEAARFENEAIRTGLQQFAAAPGHEFYGDVAGIMADMVEIQARQGQPIDLEKIYQRACQLHDGVSTILTQRAAAQSAGNNSRAVLRAKRAASSLKSDPTPGGATVPKTDSIRAAIEAAMDSAGDA